MISREKMQLEVDKAQKEADIRIRNGEVAALQKEQDALNLTVSQLENQKAEAQKRLDELDDKVTRTAFQSETPRSDIYTSTSINKHYKIFVT